MVAMPRPRRIRLVATLVVGGAMASFAASALVRRFAGAEVVDRDDRRLDVRLAAPGVVRGSVNVGLMRYPIAKPFCENIEELALRNGADALVMDMTSLSKATPKAGMYAMKRCGSCPCAASRSSAVTASCGRSPRPCSPSDASPSSASSTARCTSTNH
jgi:hypothetical protein